MAKLSEIGRNVRNWQKSHKIAQNSDNNIHELKSRPCLYIQWWMLKKPETRSFLIDPFVTVNSFKSDSRKIEENWS
jgi:hypothetical protein